MMVESVLSVSDTRLDTYIVKDDEGFSNPFIQRLPNLNHQEDLVKLQMPPSFPQAQGQ